MSLINQMLKDLEQRGAGSTDTTKISPSAINASTSQAGAFPFVKVGLLITLLAGGAYSWLQTKSKLDTPTATGTIPVTTPSAIRPATAITKPDTSANTIPEAPQTAVADPAAPSDAKVPSLFETELKFAPAYYQAPQKNISKNKAVENAPAAPVATKPNEPTVSSNTPSEKPAAPKPSSGRLSSKLSNENAATGKEIRPDQKSGNYYRLALSNLQQGRVSEAQANLNLALEANPANQDARQTLAGLLIDNKRNDEAKSVLVAGLAITPEQSDFRMALARLQVESGDRSAALATLEQGLSAAKGNTDYQSFTATLLQRAERHEDAINHYMSAVSLGAATPSTLIGLGISLQAVGKLENAKEAFTRAQSNTTLSPELSQFVEQRLKQINQRLRG